MPPPWLQNVQHSVHPSRGGDVIFPWSFAESLRNCLQIIRHIPPEMPSPVSPSTEPYVCMLRSTGRCRNRTIFLHSFSCKSCTSCFFLNFEFSGYQPTFIFTYPLSFKHNFPHIFSSDVLGKKTSPSPLFMCDPAEPAKSPTDGETPFSAHMRTFCSKKVAGSLGR
jgi:hypothetical protein